MSRFPLALLMKKVMDKKDRGQGLYQNQHTNERRHTRKREREHEKDRRETHTRTDVETHSEKERENARKIREGREGEGYVSLLLLFYCCCRCVRLKGVKGIKSRCKGARRGG